MTNKNYKYIILPNETCPYCKTYIGCWHGPSNRNRGNSILCHLLKRVVVSGFWFWRKYCPIDGTHDHVICYQCNIKWIVIHSIDNEQKILELPFKT